jgi:coproporphyrinogen III oxidase-like Fe-S oxidoreductase
VNAASEVLTRRMARPQRHRLLHGYPMTPLLRAGLGRARDGSSGHPKEGPFVTPDPSRPLLIGVLPHTQCAPTVDGCGFCTFPHDRFDKPELRHVASRVAESVDHVRDGFEGRRVEGVYLGGATANLTPRAQLQRLVEALARRFDLTAAEVTLEGVPSLFTSWFPGVTEVLRDLPCGQRRLSMGIQTFDPTWLARMGRTGFGDRRVVEKIVARAHAIGATASGDLLASLPGRPLADELADVQAAIDVGLDQICVYPLILAGDTPWAQDPAMVAGLPGVEASRERWRAVVELLRGAGFEATTLTNFERPGSPRFRYEVASFAPDRYDMLGLGPLSISTLVDVPARRAVKLLRGRSAEERLDPERLWFPYEAEDLSLLLVTRMCSVGAVEQARYRAVMGEDLTERHGNAVTALVERGLATLDARALTLTDDGRFYADAVVGTFAEARAAAIRDQGAGVHTADLASGRVITTHMG